MAKIIAMVMFSVFAINVMSATSVSTQIARSQIDPALTMYALR